MDHGACNVVYIDRRANDEHVRKETLSKSLVARTSTGNVGQSYFALGKTSPREVHDNVEAILSISNEGTLPSRTSLPMVNTANPCSQSTSAAPAGPAYRKSPSSSTPHDPAFPPLL